MYTSKKRKHIKTSDV